MRHCSLWWQYVLKKVHLCVAICIYLYIYISIYIYIYVCVCVHVRAKFFANNQVELPNAYYNGCLTTCSKCVTLVDIYTWHCVTKSLAVLVNKLRPRLNGYHISDVMLLLSLSFLYEKAFWLNFTTKVQFRGPRLFKKKRAIFQEELHLPGIFMLSWTNWRGDTIVDGWPQFECNFNVFVDMILSHVSHYIDITASPEPFNGATGT